MELTIELLEEKFKEYNKKYFSNKLPWIEIGLHNSFACYGEFKCDSHKPGRPLKNAIITISCYYDYTDEQLRDILVHEMVHYKLERSKNPPKRMHGKEFKEMIAEMNEKYGLNMTAKGKVQGLKISENAPKKSWARFFFT